MSHLHPVLVAGTFFVFISLLRYLFSTQPVQPTGDSDFAFKWLEECPRDILTTGEIVLESTRINKHHGSSYSYSSNITLRRSFSDRLDFFSDVAIQRWGNYHDHFRQFHIKGACETMRYFTPDFFRSILEIANTTSCPIPPGTYELHNIPLEVLRPPSNSPKWPYGSYRMTSYITERRIKLFCIRFYIDIIPRRK